MGESAADGAAMRHPTLQQLRLFAAVARHKSITRAAQEVHLTQPSVSMQVRRLEEKVGHRLTEQIGKSMHLTAAGQEVAAAASDILGRIGDLETALDDMQRQVGGPLSISVVSSGKYFLPQLLGSFKRRYPLVEPKLQITNRDKVIERMSRNADDLYIMGRPPADDALTENPFLENNIVCIAPPDHPLAGQKSIPLSRLAQENVIRREPGSGTRRAVDVLFAQSQVGLTTLMEFDDTDAIKNGVASGLGIAFMSLHALRLELAAGELTVLDVAGFPLHRRWFAVHRTRKHLTKTAGAFLDFLQTESGSVLDTNP